MRAHPFLPTLRRHLARICAIALVFAAVGIGGAAGAAPRSANDDPAFLSEWNALAATTFIADTTKPGPVPFLYMGFVQAAVYDAVNGVHRRYEPYRFRAHAPRRASAAAAAVAAAHRIVVTYSPGAQATLDAAYAASLARIPDGRSKTDGIEYGIRVADSLIAARANDGRDAPVLFTKAPAPGVWRPTPPAFAPMIGPWLGGVTPMMVRSATQFGDPGPPPALTSARYTREFDEVKALGSATSTVRTAEQTATALFFSGNAVAQFNYGLRDEVLVRHLDIVRAARMFAAVDMSQADTLISVWYAKLKYGFWRPLSAITLADTDGNPATTAEPTWTPLLVNPPYPDWVSGYSAQTGSFTRALAAALGTRHLRVTLNSTAVQNELRQYDSGAVLRSDVVNARMWLGIHFRSTDEVGARMGEEIAEWAMDRYFEPVRH